MKRSIPVKVSKRKAREERIPEFAALVHFANLGDLPDARHKSESSTKAEKGDDEPDEPMDWAKFRHWYPKFFPANITARIYVNAKVWWELSNLPDTRPDKYPKILLKYRFIIPDKVKAWTRFAGKCRREMRLLRPYLLYYRNLLRRVWRRKDPYRHAAFNELLGIAVGAPVLENGEEQKEEALVYEEGGHLIEIPGHVDWGALFNWKGPEWPKQHTLGGVTWIDKQTETSSGLPIGTLVVDDKKDTIEFEFGSKFQEDIYHLMQEPWRPKVCPWCRKYFIADKRAQKYCSPQCCGKRKAGHSLDYYRRIAKSRPRKQNSKAPQTRAHRKKS